MLKTEVYKCIVKLDSYFLNFIRLSIFLVMVWIGRLNAFQYEAGGIVRLVANSPLMSFL